MWIIHSAHGEKIPSSWVHILPVSQASWLIGTHFPALRWYKERNPIPRGAAAGSGKSKCQIITEGQGHISQTHPATQFEVPPLFFSCFFPAHSPAPIWFSFPPRRLFHLVNMRRKSSGSSAALTEANHSALKNNQSRQNRHFVTCRRSLFAGVLPFTAKGKGFQTGDKLGSGTNEV